MPLNDHFPHRTLTGLLGLSTLAGGTLLYGNRVEAFNYEVTYHDIVLPTLDKAFDGYRLVHISDIHLDSENMTRERFARAVSLVNEQNPDVIVITGDFVTHPNEYDAKDDLIATLSQLQARVGIFAVTGNHDHMRNIEMVRDILNQSGIPNLHNDFRTIERGDAMLHIAGVDDYWKGQHDLDAVLEALPAEGTAILLAHEPDFAHISSLSGRFDLQLSGHSHGGQVRLPVVGEIFVPAYSRDFPIGFYEVNRMILYVNRGLGVVPPPIRINCRPEITVFRLRGEIG